MHSRLSQNDVTNLVNVEDAGRVRDAIIAIYGARYPPGPIWRPSPGPSLT